MKLSSFKIQNFKSFGKLNDTQGRVQSLKKINMIYGYNNSGKSNVLKFLNLIFKNKTQTQTVTFQSDFGEEEVSANTNLSAFYEGDVSDCAYIFHKNDTSKPVEFEFTFAVPLNDLKKVGTYYAQLKSDYIKTSNHETFPLTFSGTIKSIDGFHTGLIKVDTASLNSKNILSHSLTGISEYLEESKKLKGNKEVFEKLMNLFSEPVLFLDNGRYLKDLSNGDDKELTPENYKNWLFQQYINPETYSKFEQLINFIQNNRIKSKNGDHDFFKSVEAKSPLTKFTPEFSKTKDGGYEIMLKAGNERFPLSSFGTGIHQILFILSSIFDSKAKIILIEEMEMNLSPKYQKALLTILQKLIDSGKIDQVFFTTHSKYFIYRNDFSIYEVSMDENGSKISKINAKKHWKQFFNLD